jgi:heme/copper-type cytochrome/quinol oxidase subunit 4
MTIKRFSYCLKDMLKGYAVVAAITVLVVLAFLAAGTIQKGSIHLSTLTIEGEVVTNTANDIDNFLMPLSVSIFVVSIITGCTLLSFMRMLMLSGASRRESLLTTILASLLSLMVVTLALFLLHLGESSHGAWRFASTVFLLFLTGYFIGTFSVSFTTLAPTKVSIPALIILYAIIVPNIIPETGLRNLALVWVIVSAFLTFLILLTKKSVIRGNSR